MEIGPLTTRAVLTVKESDSLRDAAIGMVSGASVGSGARRRQAGRHHHRP